MGLVVFDVGDDFWFFWSVWWCCWFLLRGREVVVWEFWFGLFGVSVEFVVLGEGCVFLEWGCGWGGRGDVWSWEYFLRILWCLFVFLGWGCFGGFELVL